MVLILFETPAGYALFRMQDDGQLDHPDTLSTHFDDSLKANQLVQLMAFSKFKSTVQALEAAAALVEGVLSKPLKKFLKKNILKTDDKKDKTLKYMKEKLVVADTKLGSAISKKLGLSILPVNNAVHELFRGIRSQLENLIQSIPSSAMTSMSLGLSHSLSRYKLKFSPDKVDTMIIQAVGLLDDLDKEINTYAMRVKEWYGWHFPELTKIITDNIAYAKVVSQMGLRSNASTSDLASILPEEIENEVKNASLISMGTDISDEDIHHICALCEQVIQLHQYRTQLYAYLTSRMQAITPNLTALVGELVGARLISHAGSLMNLAKHPASTIQILGAEKALFRALKTKKDTPKYGLLYHATLVGQAQAKNKGKIARLLATKAALSIRVDALTDQPQFQHPQSNENEKKEKKTPLITTPLTNEVGMEARVMIEKRLRDLELRNGSKRISGQGKHQSKYDASKGSSSKFQSKFNPANDFTPSGMKRKQTNGGDAFNSIKKQKVELGTPSSTSKPVKSMSTPVSTPVNSKTIPSSLPSAPLTPAPTPIPLSTLKKEKGQESKVSSEFHVQNNITPEKNEKHDKKDKKKKKVKKVKVQEATSI
ncbi:Nucleolar protein 58 [Coelomomyces lativittatus]|nr:Nucleolar protein 58 [Coelomomyces lativittatus]KAJ1518097.1 Nucleolar protein 58 [Coelomomyces lativittatus]